MSRFVCGERVKVRDGVKYGGMVGGYAGMLAGSTTVCFVDLDNVPGNTTIFLEDLDTYVEPKNKPHKHAALIKAWADGAQIQACSKWHPEWVDVILPGWGTECDYRIKPEPKPDRVEIAQIYSHGLGLIVANPIFAGVNPNIKCTFDGETGALKAVELINKE